MTIARSPASPLHRAALSLHGLGGEDRDWILRALPDEQSGKLRDLLRELQELGVPASGIPMHQWTNPSHGASQGFRGAISSVTADELARLLAAEPPRVRHVLRAAQPSLWASVPPHEDDSATVATVPDADRAPALRAAVLAAVRGRLATAAVPDVRGARTIREWASACFRNLRRP